ncbi:MAG: type 1 glutamine amidotransferase [Verrucomicrobiota bacterium]
MKIHWFQHVPYEGLGMIEEWADSSGHSLEKTFWPEKNTEPDLSQADALIIMGGPMSVNDSDQLPWLAIEKESLQNWLQTGRPVLGICLGAQLIAESLDGVVIENPERELGWYPLATSPGAAKDPLLSIIPDGLHVFHWHGETFTMLHKVIPLGASTACPRQGFHAPPGIIGFQFHLELGSAHLEELVGQGHLPEWEGPFIQDQATILKEAKDYEAGNKKVLFQLLDQWSQTSA